ncbi:hypothetical protein SLS53_006293 [Cytospora paraplurivora]|uniref:Haloacid dehalogenase n=1 Tax=Cytospora paraplurivora TaxID=2898453 RepID=A0AAN9UAH8_9PEZI
MPVEALRDIKALTFDVFGTVVNWRSTVESALKTSIESKKSSHTDLPAHLLRRIDVLTDPDYARFAQEWRDSYKRFTRGFRAGETAWKDIDAHHHDSLVELLDEWQLAELYTPGEVRELSLVWHRLDPWPDSAPGLRLLGAGGLGLVTATLSNGNQSLLADLDSFGGLGYSRLISAEDFGVYKPDPRVYLGAAERLGVRPGEVAMVAAHLNDLEAARQLGLRTIYVERKGEEDWGVDEERYRSAVEWVDLWVGLDENGFVQVAEKLKEIRS